MKKLKLALAIALRRKEFEQETNQQKRIAANDDVPMPRRGFGNRLRHLRGSASHRGARKREGNTPTTGEKQ